MNAKIYNTATKCSYIAHIENVINCEHWTEHHEINVAGDKYTSNHNFGLTNSQRLFDNAL